MNLRRNKNDIESQRTGESKDNNKHFKYIKMEEQSKFIGRSYWLCVLLFMVSGLAMFIAVLQGAYNEVVLAETLMVSVLGTIYMVLFVVMIFCSSNETLRVAILLFISCKLT